MKKLLLFICIINLTAKAQDSTSISFSTETVDEFRKQSLMDEYERAFGSGHKVNTRVKVGFMDFSFLRYESFLPYVSAEQRIGKRVSALINLIPSSNTGYFSYYIRTPDSKLKLSFNSEIRYYLDNKGSRIMSGNYLGAEYRNVDHTLPHKALAPMMNKPYYSKNQFSINLGKQFGSSADIGLQLGLKNIQRTYVDSSGYFKIQDSKTFIPFIAIFSKIGIGIDYPFRKNKNSESCEFLNCYSEFGSIFKVDFSNLFYFDPYFQNLKIDLAYEKRIGLLPLSFNFGLVLNLDSERNYIRTSETGPTQETAFEVPLYINKKENQVSYSLISTLELRYYLFQKRAIAKGKAVSNLSGLYTALFYSRSLSFSDPYKYMYISPGAIIPTQGPYIKYLPGGKVGLQKKILKNYYYDFGLRYMIPRKNIPFSTGFEQEIKFGYAF